MFFRTFRFRGGFFCNDGVFSHCLFGRTHYAALVVKGIADLGRIRRSKDLPGLIGIRNFFILSVITFSLSNPFKNSLHNVTTVLKFNFLPLAFST